MREGVLRYAAGSKSRLQSPKNSIVEKESNEKPIITDSKCGEKHALSRNVDELVPNPSQASRQNTTQSESSMVEGKSDTMKLMRPASDGLLVENQMKKVTRSQKIYAATRTILSTERSTVTNPGSPKSVTKYPREEDSFEKKKTIDLAIPGCSQQSETSQNSTSVVPIETEQHSHKSIVLNKAKRQEIFHGKFHGHSLC